MQPPPSVRNDGPDVDVRLSAGVGVLTIARPPVNAFRTQTYRELGEALASLQADEGCRVIVLVSGVPGIFSAGADVKELPMPRELDEQRQRLARDVLTAVQGSPVPVVCAIAGPALGAGFALAAACDIRLAARSASFGLPEITVGRCGGARHAMRVLPQGLVRQMYFTGRPIGADVALAAGMVNELLPDEDAVGARALEVATDIAAKSPTALRLAKQALDLVEWMPLTEGYAVEQQFSLRLAGTPDAVEAAAAFREHRAPRWQA